MVNDKKLLREEETCKTDRRAPIYNECDPHHIQILLHAVQPGPRTFPRRAADHIRPPAGLVALGPFFIAGLSFAMGKPRFEVVSTRTGLSAIERFSKANIGFIQDRIERWLVHQKITLVQIQLPYVYTFDAALGSLGAPVDSARSTWSVSDLSTSAKILWYTCILHAVSDLLSPTEFRTSIIFIIFG